MTPLITVPCMDQTKDWPTGCESVTAVMLLRALGYPVTMKEWVENDLICSPFRISNGILYGPDPRECFAGRPDDPDSMGCYSSALAAFLNHAFARLGAPWKAVIADGMTTDKLSESLRAGIPVAYWATIDQRPAVPGPCWHLDNGEGEFLWLSNEHCMLLVGCDKESLWFNDPLHTAESPTPWPRALAEQRHREQGSMAVMVLPR